MWWAPACYLLIFYTGTPYCLVQINGINMQNVFWKHQSATTNKLINLYLTTFPFQWALKSPLRSRLYKDVYSQSNPFTHMHKYTEVCILITVWHRVDIDLFSQMPPKVVESRGLIEQRHNNPGTVEVRNHASKRLPSVGGLESLKMH